MNKVLLIGNGFDLAHGLPTKYNHFLEFVRNWEDIYTQIKNIKSGTQNKGEEKYSSFLACATKMNEENLEELDRIISNNSWVDYYCNCEAEIDGWIDFEKEIYPVAEMFDKIFKSDCQTVYSHGEIEAYIDKHSFSIRHMRIAELWHRYLRVGGKIIVNAPYVSGRYGILKKEIMKALRKEFDDFIRAFEIYLLEVVHRRKNISLLKQIKNINADYVVSCNYTLTEQLYGLELKNIHHIHGMIREDTKCVNNMVVGISEKESIAREFIYFVKYFQRIQKHSGTLYKNFVNKGEMSHGVYREQEYSLHIFGHSLDETDEDILKELIGESYSGNEFKAKRVVIYYYDSDDYEQKVINLLNLYGREKVENAMENGKIKFVMTTPDIWEENNKLCIM